MLLSEARLSMTGWDAITDGAGADSPLWATMVRALPRQEREPVFSALAKPSLAETIETIYEAYLVHLGRSRLFAPPDADTALLLGDYLFARGLARAQALGEPRLVADLAELISTVAHMRAEGGDDGLVWAATAAAPGHPSLPAARERFATTGDSAALEALARGEADEGSLERALAAHRATLGSLGFGLIPPAG
jgi:hypothetical protein